jgi:thiamine pyrophosphate-dependent acetolactate synthase large subunit-like protein
MNAVGINGWEAYFGRPDLAAVASAFGLSGVRPNSRQLDDALKSHFAGSTSTLIDAHIPVEMMSPSYRRLFLGQAKISV